MSGGKVTPAELRAARQCLAAAEQGALDEVLAIRADAEALLERARAEAGEILEAAKQQADSLLVAVRAEHAAAMEAVEAARAGLHQDRSRLASDRADLDAERTVIDAMRDEVNALRDSLDRAPARTADEVDRSVAADLLEGTQAEMAMLSKILDQLVDRVADLDVRRTTPDGDR